MLLLANMRIHCKSSIMWKQIGMGKSILLFASNRKKCFLSDDRDGSAKTDNMVAKEQANSDVLMSPRLK